MSELAAFLQWNTPNLLADEIREASCHWLLLKGLGLDPGQGRPCADLQSLVLPMEEWQLSITTAAFYSAPEQQEPNPIQFRIPLTAANALVFALFSGQTTPLDPAEWSFWLVPVSKLHPERQTMGLNPLMRAFGEGVDALGGTYWTAEDVGISPADKTHAADDGDEAQRYPEQPQRQQPAADAEDRHRHDDGGGGERVERQYQAADQQQG